MKQRSGLLQLEKTSCDTELGGQRFAGKLAEHCISHFKRQYRSDPSDSPKAIAKLSGVCDAAMRTLSALQQTDIEVDSFYEGCDLRIRLSRARFDDMCSVLYRRLTSTIAAALSDACVEANHVDTVLLVGGAAKLPRVQTAVRALFSDAEFGRSDVPPDEAAALGASAQAALLAFRSDGTAVTDRKGKKTRYPRAQAIIVSSLPCAETHLRVHVGSRKVQLVPKGAPFPFE